MNAVIGNKYIDIFNSLNIEVSKKLQGEYTVDEIITTFSNFFFNKMFLDITAIKDYKNLVNLQKLSMAISMDKVILLLDKDDSISDSNQFLSRLVSMGIYSFTKDSNNLMYLYNNPNSYRDVAYLQDVNNDNSNVVNSSPEVSSELSKSNNRVILGIKNVTDSAGSSTLAYLIRKILSGYYNTMAIEVGKRDLIYFNDKDCISIDEKDFESTISKYDNVNFFIVDLGKNKREYLCDEVLYLVEPSTIKLNKLLLVNPNAFRELSGKKVILNRILLSDNDIANFEVEADIKTYYNIGPLNDKEDCSGVLLPLLSKLGYVKVSDEEVIDSNNSNKRSIFDIFKSK